MLTTGENASVPLARATWMRRGHSKAMGLSTPLGMSNTTARSKSSCYPCNYARAPADHMTHGRPRTMTMSPTIS